MKLRRLIVSSANLCLRKNDSVIRDAVLREMERGGQVYYLYNKVDTIDQKVSELQELIPEASIGYVLGK